MHHVADSAFWDVIRIAAWVILFGGVIAGAILVRRARGRL
jgi:hypothetical protein